MDIAVRRQATTWRLCTFRTIYERGAIFITWITRACGAVRKQKPMFYALRRISLWKIAVSQQHRLVGSVCGWPRAGLGNSSRRWDAGRLLLISWKAVIVRHSSTRPWAVVLLSNVVYSPGEPAHSRTHLSWSGNMNEKNTSPCISWPLHHKYDNWRGFTSKGDGLWLWPLSLSTKCSCLCRCQ